MSYPGFSEEDIAYDIACEMFHTNEPTLEQLSQALREYKQRIVDEYTNYYNQDGDN